MDIDFTEEQEILRNVARNFLEKEVPFDLIRELEENEKRDVPELWEKMAQMGWMGLFIPEGQGGIGGSFLDLFILMVEMGRACLPEIFFSSVVLGGYTLLEADDQRHNRALLPKIADGSIKMTLALTEPDVNWTAEEIQTEAIKKGHEYVISGTKLFVPDANLADYIIVVARTGSAERSSLFVLDAKDLGKQSIMLLNTMAGDNQCSLVLDRVRVSEEQLLGKEGAGSEVIARVMQKAAVAKCGEMLGGAEKALEMTVEYTKQRTQFGRTIGNFQAVQHHCTNMLIDLDAIRLITFKAACMLSEGMPCAKEVAMAKAWTNEAFNRIVALAHQVHGGVAFMEEHDLPFFFKRSKCWSAMFGDDMLHYETIARKLFN